jgi:hypothetical protein
MSCIREIGVFRVYHPPKDDLAGEVISPLLPESVSVCRFTGDVSSTAIKLYHHALAEAIESTPSFKMRWISSNRLGRADLAALFLKRVERRIKS